MYINNWWPLHGGFDMCVSTFKSSFHSLSRNFGLVCKTHMLYLVKLNSIIEWN